MSDKNDWAVSIGQFIGGILVATTTLLVSSGIFALAWRNGAAKTLGLPDLTWAEALACLICVWILATPLRVARVRISRDAKA